MALIAADSLLRVVCCRSYDQSYFELARAQAATGSALSSHFKNTGREMLQEYRNDLPVSLHLVDHAVPLLQATATDRSEWDGGEVKWARESSNFVGSEDRPLSVGNAYAVGRATDYGASRSVSP